MIQKTKTFFTTQQLMDQGYSREAAERHPGHFNRGLEALADREPASTNTSDVVGGVALAATMVSEQNEERLVFDATGHSMTPEQFREINSDPHTRMDSGTPS